jgi:hypothetical protein
VADNPFTDFKSDHHVIFGLALTTVGLLGIIGSLFGTLPGMLGALFDPSVMQGNTGKDETTGSSSSLPGGVLDPLNDLSAGDLKTAAESFLEGIADEL